MDKYTVLVSRSHFDETGITVKVETTPEGDRIRVIQIDVDSGQVVSVTKHTSWITANKEYNLICQSNE